MYKIILNDGTELNNLELNGNNFIAKSIIDNSVFEGNLDEITVINDEETVVYKNMQLMSNLVYNECSWFVLGEKSTEQIEREAYWQAITDLEIGLLTLEARV